MTTPDKPRWWSVIDRYARQPITCDLASPDVADGECWDESEKVVIMLDNIGCASEIWEGLEAKRRGRPNAWGNHFFVVVPHASMVIDMTGRQFWPDCAFPLIEPLEDYQRRFARVAPVE